MNPGDSPLGSIQSRAAARAVLNRAEDESERLEIICHIPRPDQDNTRPHATPWQPMGEGSLVRWVYVPPGMPTEAAKKVLAKEKDR